MESRNIIHVHIKSTDKHHYFGSMKAIYDVLGKEDIGVAYNTLRTRNTPDIDSPFENELCIIRKGRIFRTSKNA